jgi:hypothetical protein
MELNMSGTESQEVIQAWQNWYKSHRIVSEMDDPLVTKESRENLHDTSHATGTLPNWREHYAELIGDHLPFQGNDMYKQKATEHFADTIAEFSNEMSGEELFACFQQAAKENFKYAQKEYDRAKDLMDLLEGKTCAKK